MAKNKVRFFKLGMGVTDDNSGKRWEAGEGVSSEDLPIGILIHWLENGRIEELDKEEFLALAEDHEEEEIEELEGEQDGNGENS